jgi:adenosylcobyric acid synthase
LDVMADLLTAHLNLDAVLGLLDGPPQVRPTITSAVGLPARTRRLP